MGNKKIVSLTGAPGNIEHEGVKQLLNRRDKFNIVALVLPTEEDKSIMSKYEQERGVNQLNTILYRFVTTNIGREK